MKTIPVRIIISLVAVAMVVALYSAAHADSISFGTPYWVTSNWSNSTTPTYGAKASPNDGISCPAGSVQTGWRIVAIDPGMGVYEYGTQCQPLVSSVTLGTPYWVISNSSSGSTPTGARASSNDGITCPNGSVQTGWRIIYTSSNDAYAPEGSGGGYDSYEYGTQCRSISAAPVEPPPSSCNVVQSYTAPGTYTYTIPSGTFTVTVKGAGGGGGGKADDIRPGSAGGQSSFGNTIVARGGGGGNVSTYTASPGASGTASGGDTNTTGGGASGGSGGTLVSAATGGDGGMSVKTYQAGTLTSPVTVVVGAGGAGGATNNPSYSGRNGSSGSVVITGGANSCNPPPTLSCSVTFDQNPLTGSATTMRWTSTGAELFYINQVGWVGAPGSAQVSSPGDYSGTVSGTGGVNSQTYSTPGTYTAPRAGEVTITVIGGGGGGGGNSFNLANIGASGTIGGSGGSGAATSIVGSFGTMTASGGAGAAGGRMSNPPSSGCRRGGGGGPRS